MRHARRGRRRADLGRSLAASSSDPMGPGLAGASVPLGEALEERLLLSGPDGGAPGTTFTVTTTADSGPGSLRQAILDADGNPGLDRIAFAIGTGPQTIRPSSPLPVIVDPVLLDARTQPGFSGSPSIEIRGDAAGSGADGLQVRSGGSAVLGISIDGFDGAGIELDAGGQDLIQGDRIGQDPEFSGSVGNREGLLVVGSAGNTIGGAGGTLTDVISGNRGDGVHLVGPLSSGNWIGGDFIGVDPTGANYDGNFSSGVFLDGAGGNTISGVLPVQGATPGVATPGETVISGNLNDGVRIAGASAASNVISGALIGLNAGGTAPISNGFSGVAILDAPGTIVGGPSGASGDVISGNGLIYLNSASDPMSASGVLVSGAGSSGTRIQSDRIGTTADGRLDAGNLGDGVRIEGAGSVTVRGDVISANGLATVGQTAGVHVLGAGATGNLIAGDLIGTDFAGIDALGNKQDGVLIELGASGNTVGGITEADRDVISGNDQPVSAILSTGPFGYASAGVHLALGAAGNLVVGNFIGLDVGGIEAVANRQDGVLISSGASGNTIGGTHVGAGDAISGNAFNGVQVVDSTSSGNVILGDRIGTDPSGEFSARATGNLGNGNEGVWIVDAPGTTIGGPGSGAADVISGNGGAGVLIGDPSDRPPTSDASGAVIQGNLIGVDVLSANRLPNALGGVYIANLQGDASAPSVQVFQDVISGNNGDGVFVSDSSGVLFLGDRVGTDSSGTVPLQNAGYGVILDESSAVTLGGTAAGDANVLSANLLAGVALVGSSGNRIQGNFIGTDPAGALDLGNHDDGVILSLGSDDNTLGGDAPGAGNVIVANVGSGVLIQGADDDLVAGNFLGTRDLGNHVDGVNIIDSAGIAVSSGNVIVANGANGVEIVGFSARNLVQGDRIGIDLDDRQDANGGDGVKVVGTSGNTIGGTSPATGSPSGNLISGNGSSGVHLMSGASANLVATNFLGLDSSGAIAVPNRQTGVEIDDSGGNTIGGSSAGSRNVISGNRGAGVLTSGSPKDGPGNLIAGNFLGTDASGPAPSATAWTASRSSILRAIPSAGPRPGSAT